MKVLGKTVYVMGAGASADSGIPLLSNFLETVANFADSNIELDNKSSFRDLMAWIRSLRASRADSVTDLTNLEHVFSLISMLKESGEKQGDILFDHITNVIFETIDRSSRLEKITNLNQGSSSKFDGTISYLRFAQHLNGLNDVRRSDVPQGSFERDSIITFNYDILLDLALAQLSIPYSYCLDGPDANSFSVLKLHGSMNWASHKDCVGAQRRPIHALDLSACLLKRAAGSLVSVSSFRNLRTATCPGGCNYGQSLRPVFIPPTWSKSPHAAGVSAVWREAIRALQAASQIVVIGYSLPETDTFFKYLLTLALQNNGNLNRILIFDPDPDDVVVKRYKSILPPRFPVIFERMLFKDLADGRMRTQIYGH